MEQSNETSNLFDLQIGQQSKIYLGETSKWTKFLSILGFIFCGLIILLGVFFGSIMSSIFSGKLFGSSMPESSGMGAFGTVLVVVYILFALIYFFPCLYLFNFSNKMQTALRNNDQAQLDASFKNLKSCFKFLGIFTIVVLSIYILAIIFGMFAASTFRQ